MVARAHARALVCAVVLRAGHRVRRAAQAGVHHAAQHCALVEGRDAPAEGRSARLKPGGGPVLRVRHRRWRREHKRRRRSCAGREASLVRAIDTCCTCPYTRRAPALLQRHRGISACLQRCVLYSLRRGGMSSRKKRKTPPVCAGTGGCQVAGHFRFRRQRPVRRVARGYGPSHHRGSTELYRTAGSGGCDDRYRLVFPHTVNSLFTVREADSDSESGMVMAPAGALPGQIRSSNFGPANGDGSGGCSQWLVTVGGGRGCRRR